MRTTAWLKLKPKLTTDVVHLSRFGGATGGWRWSFNSVTGIPRDGLPVEIEQAVRVRRDEPFRC
jgi:hypothetical protein